MRLLSLLATISAVLTELTLAAHAAPPKRPIQFTEAFTNYLCEATEHWRRQAEAKDHKEWARRARAILDNYTGGPDATFPNPFPPELHDYTPTSYELFEASKNPLPCDTELYTKAKAGFRCRLDRIIFRDQMSGASFVTQEASLRALFDYGESSQGLKFDDAPRALRSGLPRVFGAITLKGRFDGKTMFVQHDWVKGSPAEVVWATETYPDFIPDKPASLPLVTPENYSLYVFRFPSEGIVAGLLKGRVFVPDRCR